MYLVLRKKSPDCSIEGKKSPDCSIEGKKSPDCSIEGKACYDREPIFSTEDIYWYKLSLT